MRPELIQALLLPLPLLSQGPPDARAAHAPTPPGMVLVKGGRTTIGTDAQQLQQMMEDLASTRSSAQSFDAETPEHTPRA